MSPSLEPSKTPIDLIDSANKSEEQLSKLKSFATEKKQKHGSGKKKALLEDVINHVNSNIQSLKAWTAAINEGRQTSDEEIKKSIHAVFENIVARVADAKQALGHRLGMSAFASHTSK